MFGPVIYWAAYVPGPLYTEPLNLPGPYILSRLMCLAAYTLTRLCTGRFPLICRAAYGETQKASG